MEQSFVPWTLLAFIVIIPHGEGLTTLHKFLETGDKQISSDTLTELA